MSQPSSSRKILIIDDQPEIHLDFQKILSPGSPLGSEGLAKLRAAVKGGLALPVTHQSASYAIDTAHQGEEGFNKIASARESGQPFSVAYVDMRMPPGWDGLRTMKAIWEADPEVQLVVCTAFSDQPWSEIDDLAGKSDRVLVLKKPFDPVEVKRMTSTLSAKWRLAREAATNRMELEELLAQRAEMFNTDHHRDVQQLQDLQAQIEQLTGSVRTVAGQHSAKAEAALPHKPAPGSVSRYALDGSQTWQGGEIG